MLVLFVGDLFHPVNNFAGELFLDGDVGHGCGGCGAVPVLLTGREPDYIAGADFFDWSAPTLGAAAAGGYDEGLTEWVRVPCSTRAGLEGYAGALDECRIGCLE